MSNRTAQRPRPKSQKASGYRRQTAVHVEERRDGTPLIFGWGKHLSRREKLRIQKRIAIGVAAAFITLAIAVLVFGVLWQNVFLPNEAIVTVDGHGIPQSLYRKVTFYLAQDDINRLRALQNQQAQLQKETQSKNSKVVNSAEAALVRVDNQISQVQASLTSGQLGQTAINDLVDDQLIQEGMTRLEQQGIQSDLYTATWAHLPFTGSGHRVSAATFAITNADIQKKLDAFKKAFPAGQSYSQFLQQSHLSDSDMWQVMMILVRRDKMQAFLAGLVQPIEKAVHVARITLATSGEAQAARYELLKEGANFAALAKKESTDVNTKNKGGDMGWIAAGEMDTAPLDRWAFAAQPGQLSPVINDNGAYDVARLLGVNDSYHLNPLTVATLKTNALQRWLDEQRAILGNRIGQPNETMVLDPNNLPANLPNNPGSIPGVPGNSIPGLNSGTQGQP
jgi:parvulin-like peptidyl-prolyl isomerase